MSNTVVFIDDEPLLCSAFESIVTRHGIPVATFTDATAALAFIEANDVAVVVCDYRMPDLSGLDVLARMPKKVPFYLVSGDLDVEEMAAGHHGVTGVLVKPYQTAVVVEKIRGHLDDAK